MKMPQLGELPQFLCVTFKIFRLQLVEVFIFLLVLCCVLLALSLLSHIPVQWIPAHRGIGWNEQADISAKARSRLQQPQHPVSFKGKRHHQLDIPTHSRKLEVLNQSLPWAAATIKSSVLRLDTTTCSNTCWRGLVYAVILKTAHARQDHSPESMFTCFVPHFRETRAQKWPHRTCLDSSSFRWHQPCQCCNYTTSAHIPKHTIKSYSLM